MPDPADRRSGLISLGEHALERLTDAQEAFVLFMHLFPRLTASLRAMRSTPDQP